MSDTKMETDRDMAADPAADPQASPDFFAAPKKGKGVRRLNRVPLFVVGGLIALAVAGITYTFFQRQQQNMATATAPVEAPPIETPAAAPVRPVGDDYVAAPPQIPTEPADPAGIPTDAATGVGSGSVAAAPSEAYQRRVQLIERIEERRLAQLEAALGAEASVQTFKLDQQPAGASGRTPGGQAGQVDPLSQYMAAAGMPGAAGGMSGPLGPGGMLGGEQPDPNQQAAKRAFLSGTVEADTYLATTRQAGISPASEVKAGTIIPGVLISGVNSDLPGQIIAQVREDVFDSATGQSVLIPAGARLIGTYDNGVTLGQTRALVAWTRIIYPDGSSLSLNMMPGADESGYAGFHDKVNNHYWKIFGNGLMLSLFSAGVQLSQPQKNTGDGYDSQQIIAAELGRQMGQLGMEMTRRNMDIQPTLEIRPGYRFNVMVTKDIVLPPWMGHPLARR